MTEDLAQLLKNLKLRRIHEVYEEQLRAAEKGDISCSGSAGNGEGAFSVSVDSALRAGIFKAWGSISPMAFGEREREASAPV